LSNPIAKRWPVNKLEDERFNAIALFQSMYGRDIRMIQRCDDLRLALKTNAAIGLEGKQLRQDLTATSRFSRVSRAR
jgi:hypothetical protein